VIKPSAASPELIRQTGRAVVFENVEEMHQAVDDESLDIDASCIMVLKNCGPKGYPGMAEVGNMPQPAKLLRQALSFPTARKGNTAMIRPALLALMHLSLRRVR
jgi:L-arabonate dehydrase